MDGSFSKHFSLLGEFCDASLSSGLVSFVKPLCKLGRVILNLSGLGERLDIGGRRSEEFGRIFEDSRWYKELGGSW